MSENTQAVAIKAISKTVLDKAIKAETTCKNAFDKARNTLLSHYKTTLENWNLLNENGMPVTSGKVLVLAFHDYPLNENNKPMGINDAIKTHKGAQFVKRAYMSIAQEQRNTKTAEEKAKQAGKGKSKAKSAMGASPEVLKKADVEAYLVRNPDVAFGFILKQIAKACEIEELALVGNDAHEAMEAFMKKASELKASLEAK